MGGPVAFVASVADVADDSIVAVIAVDSSDALVRSIRSSRRFVQRIHSIDGTRWAVAPEDPHWVWLDLAGFVQPTLLLFLAGSGWAGWVWRGDAARRS
jgi:hypothetical protein